MLKNNTSKNVGVGFATGRKNFMSVLKYQYQNWKKNGILDNPNINLHIFVAYDLKYNNLNEKEFLKIPKEIKKVINKITFIGEKQVNQICENIKREKNINIEYTQEILGTHGYGKLRNSILYKAMEENIDYLLFLDDDEYPVVPMKKEDGTIEWIEQKILSTHLQYIENCDLTFGHHSGYISPIPYFEIGTDISEDCYKNFIEAISNDIVNWDKMKKQNIENKGITYGNNEIVYDKNVHNIEYINGGKWIAGSNLCLNLKRMKDTYPFYNPPGARGEDTFFATCLKNEKVLKIPVYSFHDGFLKYTSIMDGKLPEVLEPIRFTDAGIKERFFGACIGWMRYKPLLVYVTNRKAYMRKIMQISEKLDKCLPTMCEIFETNDFLQIKNELEKYSLDVKKHYKEFNNVKETWKKINYSGKISDYKEIEDSII